MVLGVIYWAVWRVVLPKISGYELVPNKVVFNDGTVVNVVRSFFYHSFGCMTDHPPFFSKNYSLTESKNRLQHMMFTFNIGHIIWSVSLSLM